MNLEELTKSQIVLLTLLISFVTSMATGIVTVSLAEQGVSPVTNTVNKIVERTKEIVVKVEDPSSPVIIEKEVVVQEQDLVASAIAKNKNTAVAIYKSVVVEVTGLEDSGTESDTTLTDESHTATQEQVAAPGIAVDNLSNIDDNTTEATQATITETQLVFVARGLVVDNGIVVTDASMLDDSITDYTIITNTNNHIPATINTQVNGIAILDANINAQSSLVDTETLEHGQVVIVLSGTDRMRVTKTIIAEILSKSGEVIAVDTNASNITPGSIIIALDGSVVGINTGVSRETGKAWFTTANKISDALSAITDTTTED
jgi:hypothetical protein